MISSSRKDYIHSIYRLTQNQVSTSRVALANQLGVSRASVSEMLHKLRTDGLIAFTENRISLTPKGQAYAAEISAAHSIWELFLEEKLGLPAKSAHDYAHKLEYITDPPLYQALEDYLYNDNKGTSAKTSKTPPADKEAARGKVDGVKMETGESINP